MSSAVCEQAQPPVSEEENGAPRQEVSTLRPALLARYADLAALRYDYPLVLTKAAVENAGGRFAQSLSAVVDGILQQIAPRGAEGEEVRQHVLRLEDWLRRHVSGGGSGTLCELWKLATEELVSGSDAQTSESLQRSLRRAQGALPLDGDLVACDRHLPVRLLTRAWTAVQETASGKALAKIEDLAHGLSEILRADVLRSDAARTPESLARSVGRSNEGAFDFEVLSRILTESSDYTPLPERRRRRIHSALMVLESQRFFSSASDAGDRNAHSFAFSSCTAAAEAFRQRMPEVTEIIRAMTIAELEIENRYDEARHDPFFEHFDAVPVAATDLALFPSYLVCLRAEDCDAQETLCLLEILSSDLPIKVLVQTDDLLGDPSSNTGRLSPGLRCERLGTVAVGLGTAYVLQSPSSSLYTARDRIRRGLETSGPALFNVFSGAGGSSLGLPPYLIAAYALQSRAFPAFVFDPAAGDGWASRFHIDDNPQAEADWPVERLNYEDEALQRVTEDVASTFVDFAASDRRYANHLARVAPGSWSGAMVPVSRYLELAETEARQRVPYVSMIDDDDLLQRLVVDDELIRSARRCGEAWHSLQELGGIRNTHARLLLERQRAAWEEEKRRELEELRKQAATTEAVVATTAPEAPPAVEETVAAGEESEPLPEAVAPPPGDPYIETARCTTCGECIGRSSRMFAYNDNKQAYIADPDAGTFRDLVEAAEACQVAIIHPGKPRNPDEPGLPELIERAAAFN